MRIISCHIDNFGKLSNVDFDFTEGYNCIIEDNGWGKSTFAVFLKAMFYGLSGDKIRNDIDNERRRYKPWNGGVFGGTIQIENQGNQYVITRTFGGKSSEDFFEIRDAVTNLPSTDFTDNIGEELYKINISSFSNTAFISQDDVETNVDSGISAKVTNLEQHSFDMVQFDKAKKIFEEYLNSNTPSRKTGRLKKMKQEISELKEEVKKIKGLENSIEQNREKINNLKQTKSNLRTEQERLEEKQKKISISKDLETMRKEYDILISQKDEWLRKIKDIETNFNGIVPASQDIIKYRKMAEEINAKTNVYRLSEAEYDSLESLEYKYASGVPSQEEIWNLSNDINELNGKKENIRQIEDDISMYEQMNNKPDGQKTSSNTVFTAMLLTGIFVVMVGIILSFIVEPIVGVLMAGVGMLLLVLSFIEKRGRINTHNAEDDKNEWIKEKKQKIAVLYSETEVLQQRINSLFDKYNLSYPPTNEYSVPDLHQLTRDVENYNKLRERDRQYQECNEELSSKKIEFINYMSSIRMEYVNPEQLSTLEKQVNEYGFARKEYEQAYDKVTDFQNANKEFMMAMSKEQHCDILDESSLGEISQSMRDLTSKQEHINGQIADYSKQMEEQQNQLDELGEKADRLRFLEEQYEDEYTKYNLVQQAYQSLSQAKDSFIARYMEPLMNSFMKYYELIDKCSSREFMLDANVNITSKECGVQRNVKSLSKGYQDMIGICMRMALMDAMYQDEKPFVIFDDPFVNLDGDKLAGALQLIKEFAKEYQVIYFTCHSSRSI